MATRTDLKAHLAVTATAVTDQDISDAYVYLLGRLLVLRQQQLDFAEGFRWNTFVHRRPGAVDWPNPNLDVAYSEAWIASDENSATLLSVPKITGRYFTVQFLNGWGETLANINERVFPGQPFGRCAICSNESRVAIPDDARRIDLPVKHSRVLARVELGADREAATELQRQFQLTPTGVPAPYDIPKTPMFDMAALPGVEAFDAAEGALQEADLNPGMEALQTKVRAIARATKDPRERARIDRVIRQKALADFAKAAPVVGHGTVRNGWARPSTAGVYGEDFLTRSLVNFGGIWANTFDEVIYYKGALDNTGAVLHSDNTYTMTFSKTDLPANFVKYFWSVIAVDASRMRVLPNPLSRFLLNNQSALEYGQDGSLTLYFAADRPQVAPSGNWLPTPKGQVYRLTFRFYGPRGGVVDGSYFPPPLTKQNIKS